MNTSQVSVFHEILFNRTDQLVYAILDGASFGNLASYLNHYQAEYVCLYRGELAADIAAVAPYLVRLPAQAEVTAWVLSHIGQNYPGIFVLTSASMRELRKHFRKFLMIYDEDNQPVYFRYYDPRILRCYLPSCSAEEKQVLFGPVSHYYAENEEGDQLLEFTLEGKY